MALHQQRQAKCREVRAASMAQHLQQRQQNQQKQPKYSPNDIQMADNIREFYRTPTMLAEDESFNPHGQLQPEHQLREEEHEEEHEQERGGWKAISIEEPSSTSYDMNSLVEEPDVQEPQAQEVKSEMFGEGDKFSHQTPLWLPSEEDRRTPTLPWTSSIDADVLIEVGTASNSGGGRRKSTKKTPAPPPPSMTRSQTHSLTSPNPKNERICPRAPYSSRYFCAILVNYDKYDSECRLAGLSRESVTSLHRAMVQCPKPLSLTSLVDTEFSNYPRTHLHSQSSLLSPIPLLPSLGPALNRAINTALIVTTITI
ncbi:unnamed protein product [Hydatigera taeniaeformis]|uniref:Uncharacterized protein n=1 Tax=Hydatigena taeniaeformis TaxID=6205 RepID=A0A0R3WLH7_HYDTA|nr:unnamed protein product [Hydatigera taeniaeformis]